MSWWVGRIFLWSEALEESNEGDSAWYKPTWYRIFCLAVLFYASSVALVFFVLYSRMLQYGGWTTLAGKLSVEVLHVKSGTTEDILRNRYCNNDIIGHVTSKNNLDFWPDVLFPALIFIAGGIWGGYLIYRNFSESSNAKRAQFLFTEPDHYRFRPKFFTEGVLNGWINSGLAISYLLSVVSVLVLSYNLQVTAPFVWYEDDVSGGSNDYGTESWEESARFLSHSNGYWYAVSQPICVNSFGTPLGVHEYYRSIMAIPDKNAVDVRLVDADRDRPK
jgi:hypothetical protein